VKLVGDEPTFCASNAKLVKKSKTPMCCFIEKGKKMLRQIVC